MPLYNPYEPASLPQAPRQAPRRNKAAKNLTLQQMMDSPNPRVRQAAKKALKIQEAVNTVNNAASRGVTVQKFLSENPYYKEILSGAGIDLSEIGGASQTRTPFWTRDEFKEIVSESQKYTMNQSQVAQQFLSDAQSGVQNATPVFNPIDARSRGYVAPKEAESIMSVAPDTKPTDAALGALISQATQNQNPTLNQAKTAFIPEIDSKGNVKVDEYGDPVFTPFEFDDPETTFFNFTESAEWKNYQAAVKSQGLSWWKERFEMGKFWFFQNALKRAGEGLTNAFSWQKEYITQEDNLNLEGTALNLAYNTLVYVQATAQDMYYTGLGPKFWQGRADHERQLLADLKANPRPGDADIIRIRESNIVFYDKQAENAKNHETYFQDTKQALHETWENFQTARAEDKDTLFTTINDRLEPEFEEYKAKQLSEQEQAKQFAQQVRPQAYYLVQEANKLVETDPEKSLATYRQAVELMMEVQAADAKSDPNDPTWSFTWVQEPAREKKFREAMATLEIQKGAPLTTSEVRRAKQYYENVWREFWGEAIFDVTNLIPGAAMEKMFAPLGLKFWDETATAAVSAMRSTSVKLADAGWSRTASGLQRVVKAADVTSGFAKKAVQNFPIVSYLRRQTVASVASKRQNSVYYLFSRISGSYRTTDDFLNSMENIAQLANQIHYIADEPTARAAFKTAQETNIGLQSVTFDEFKRFFDVLDVDDGGIDFTKWRAMYEEAALESEPEIRRMTEQVLRKSGQITDEAALLAEVNRQVESALNSPAANGWTLGNFSEKFAGAYTDAHRLYKGSVLFDDSLSGRTALFFRKIADDQAEDSLVRKIFKEVTDKWESGAKLTLGENWSHRIAATAAARNQAAKRTAMLMADTIEGMVKIGKFAVDIWAMFVLSLNPRWVVQNYIDSSVRAWIAGSNPLDSAATMVLSMHRQLVDELGFLPIELGQSLARDGLNFSTSVTGRLVYGDWKPLPGPLGFLSYFQYEVDRLKTLRNVSIEEASVEAAKALSQRYPEGSIMRSLTNMMGGVKFYGQALSGAAQDFNTAIEFTLRLRLFHGEYFKNLRKLSRVLNETGAEILSPQIQGLAKQIWDSADSNPRKLSALVESVLREGVKENPSAWTSILPPGLEKKMSQLTDSERSLLISDIRSNLDVLVESIYKEGRAPVADDFVKFFDEYMEDFQNTVNLQLANFRQTKTISGQIGKQTARVPDPTEVVIKGAAVDREKVTSAIERIGKNVRGRFTPAKSFDDFKIAMTDMAPIEVVPGSERHILRSPDGKLRVTVGQDLITGKKRAELNDLMHEVAIKTFVQHEAEFAVSAGFKSADEFEEYFRLFLTEEGPAKVLSRNPDRFLTIVEELETNPQLHRILERTKGKAIPYEATWKLYMNNLPMEKLHGQAWFDMLEARADQIHVPPPHTRHAAIRQAQETKNLQLIINSKKLPEQLEQEVRNFLGMYDQARKDLGQFYLWTEPGPKQLSGKARASAWDAFYWRQAEAYQYGETLKAELVKMLNESPDEAMEFLRNFNADFYTNFLNRHGITDFSIIETAPKVTPPPQGEGAFAVAIDYPANRPPVTQFKMVRGGKTYNVQSPYVRKDLYERFLSPEKKASILTTERFDLSDVKSEIPLKDQLFTAVHDSFKLTNEQAKMYSRILNDHIDMMVQETGEDAEYFLKRMGFLRVEGGLRAPDVLRMVQSTLDTEGRHLLYGFGAQNSTDLIRQTSIMFYEDLLTVARKSEGAMDDIHRLGDYLEKITGKKMIKGKLGDEHIQAFAEAFQKYILSGDAPNSKLKKPFERYATWMSKVTGNALDNPILSDLPEDVVDVMDKMFTRSKMQEVPAAANRTMRIMAREAGVNFKNKNDLLNIINEAVAPIKKADRASLRQAIAATGSMTDDQVDAIVTMLEYRARAWGAINKRPPSEYLQNFKLVTTQQDMNDALTKMGKNPKFQAWFGNSQVLDEAGAPKVMYTGTRYGGFKKFDPTAAKGEENLFGPGFYFTENPEIASEYATYGSQQIQDQVLVGRFLTPQEHKRLIVNLDETIKSGVGDTSLYVEMRRAIDEWMNAGKTINDDFFAWFGESPNFEYSKLWSKSLSDIGVKEMWGRPGPLVMPTYLSIQNPFDLDQVFTRDEAIAFMETIDPYTANWLKHSTGMPTIKGEDLYNTYIKVNNISKAEANRAFQAVGYDGFTHIGGGRFVAGDTRKHRVFIAFEPTQIKSVFNSGEFGITDADILNKFEGLTEVADRRMPAYEQLRNAWDKMDEDDRREVFMWLTERTLTDPLSGIETLVAKSLNEKPTGWVEATSDLNALTAINNTWGHEAGDTLISGIGKIAKEEVTKEGGRVFRVGGDEFTYWFPDTDAAARAMRAIDERVQQEVFIVGGKKRKGFTVSYGIAENHSLADEALYADKQRRIALGQRPLVRDQMPMTVETLNKADNLQSYLGRFGMKDGKKAIAIFNGADFSTLPHEFGHMFRTELPEADLRIIEKATGLGEGDFDFLRSKFGEYNRALEGHLTPEALNMSRDEYNTYFKKLQADANRYEKAEEMFADGFVHYLKTGQAPIPEMQSTFDKFKQWLTELWHIIIGNSDLSLELTPEVRGVYDRLFELPVGEVRPPVRFQSLAEVPQDLAAGVFKSRASEQIAENLDAAFSAWRLRHGLEGIPQPALKNFATAKAFVWDQFNNTTGDLADQYRIMKWRFEQFEDTIIDAMKKQGFLQNVDKTVDDFFAPALSEYHMDDGVKTFMRNGAHNRAIYEQMQAGIQEWRKFLTQAAENGTPFPVLTKEEADSLRAWAKSATERKAKLMELAVNGGKFNGVSVEGALTKTNRVMLDYQDRNNFDQIMKNIFPFWMFPSRSLPFWVKTLATHPQIMMLYQKMRKMSESSRYQAGAVTSSGKPLPSLENYIPIPGLDMWINPMAPLSFRYLLDMQSYGDDMLYKARTVEEGDDSAFSFLAKQFMETSPIFGFTPGPWAQFAIQKAGVPTQQWSLIPQTNLIPPWWFPEFIQRSETMMNWMAPEPVWHDFLVERDMLEELTPFVNDPKITDMEKKRRLGEIGEAIAQKGDNPIWQAAYKKYVEEEKKRNSFAFVTGFYPKEFSDEQAGLLQARNEYIMRASAMNNSFQSNMLQIPLNEQVRWDDYKKQYAVDTPLGWLYHLYRDIGWVTDESGNLVKDPQERAKLVADRVEQDNMARAYFQKAQQLERWKNENLAILPIGASYDQTHEVLDKYYTKLQTLREQLMPPYMYRGSNKPVTLLEADLRNLWWKNVTMARPAWNGEEEYDSYQKRLLKWEQDLPKIARTYAPYFQADPEVRDILKYLDTDQPLDFDKLMSGLVAETGLDSYNLWKLENDDIFTAMNTVWKENYWDKYWDTVGGLEHEERDIAEIKFFERNKVPDLDTIYAWVVGKYGPERFTMDDVTRWVMYDPQKNLDVYGIDERHLQDVGEVAVTRERIWSLLSWAGPGKQRDILQSAFLDVGGDPSDLEKWYDLAQVGGAWQDDPEHVMAFYNKLVEAADAVSLRAPDVMQLEQFLAAREENNLLTQLMEEELGKDYQKLLDLYFAKSDVLEKRDFNIWKRENREITKLVKDYFYIRDRFAYSHKLWASYYQWKPKPKTTNLGEPGLFDNAAPLTNPVGTSRKADEIMQQSSAPAQTPQRTFSFGPPWPKGMKNQVSQYLIREIEASYRGYGNLSSSSRSYLNSLYKRHPEWRAFIEQILSS